MKITKNKVLIGALILICFIAGFSAIEFFGSKKKSPKISKTKNDQNSTIPKTRTKKPECSKTEEDNLFSEILRNTENVPNQNEIQEVRLRYHGINEKARNFSIKIMNIIRMMKLI
ncbi:hypothetical protein CWI36_0228p0010 [Hamiltosporidium magnivora]|uniref:Uncharacterized protein n=1 Tax=Hamiltosporidium magnivora TaxID=148818 RepID=A0A4Q9LI08_9MICR|nr:hypothetical protein CWI36_0228p0010 [Hamiltosporidium magnivora]